jgi:hypothetical protein
MIWANLWLVRLAVVPDHIYLDAAVVVLGVSPAAAARVILAMND